MGGSSSQVVGYRYYSNYLAFIGNRIERLLGFNFNKQGWIPVVRRIYHSTYQTDYIHLPNHYGENEGGISGTVYTYLGDNYQLVDTALDADEEGEASAFPYQSYCCFNGGIINPEVAAGLTEEELQEIADQYHDGVIPGRGFYLGNSGYMKEMLLWVKRIHVRNDGRPQWYNEKADIDTNRITPGKYMIDAESLKQQISTNPNKWYVTKLDGQTSQAPIHFSQTGGINVGLGETGSGSSIPIITTKLSGYTVSGTVVLKVVINPRYCRGLLTWDGDLLPFAVEVGDIHSADNTHEISLVWAYERRGMQPTIKFTANGFNDGTVTSGKNNTVFISYYIYESLPGFLNVDGIDINPIHKIREILTDDTAMGKPESDVSGENFVKAADRIWDEGLGISWAIDEKSCIDAIEELCYHIEAGIRVNRQTGLYEMVLFRDDWFDEDEIHTIAENKIKGLSLEVMNSDDIVNQLNVTYYDRERIKNSTFSVYENGSILTMGHANAESIDFPYFMNMRNAEIVANWKLKQYSTPAWKGTFTTGWREARKWNRYDLVEITWSKKWQGTILARIMKIDLGNGLSNEVVIDFEEVVPYSGEMNTSIVVDAPIDSTPQPPQPSINAVFEAPYYLTVLRAGQTNADLELSNNPDIGYVAAIAAKPQSNSLNALLYTDGGVDEFEQVSRLDYCDILQLDQSITETTSAFVVTGSLTQTANSNNLILLNDELMGFVSFDDETKVLTVKRGVLDTIPKKHNSGNLFIFDLPDVAFDSTQYAQSEIVGAQVLTTTPSGIQELSTTGIPVEIQARAIRPYPPANVKINGEYWLEEIETDLIVTWVDRNRLQQTGGTPLSWFDNSVAIEPGTQTHLILTQLDEDNLELATTNANVTGVTSYTMPISAMQADSQFVKITLKTLRDGYECLNPFTHTVELSHFFSAPYNITYTVSDL